MIFNFKNLGIIEEANIELNGLTVITGLNDTGKSFLSKSIYSIIKTIREAKDQELSNKADAFEQGLRPLLVLVKQFNSSPMEQMVLSFRIELLNSLLRKLPNDVILSMVSNLKAGLLSSLDTNNLQSHSPSLNSIFSQIENLLTQELEVDKMYIQYFDRMIIQQLFRSQINTLGKNTDLLISCLDKDGEILRANIKNNKTINIKLNNPFYYQNATLIDTPIILQLAFFIRQSRVRPSYLNRKSDDGLPSYYLDLVYKLATPTIKTELPEEFKSIESLIGGKFIFKEKSDNFVFQKNNGDEIESMNTASGIKSFGLIQLLMASSEINSRTLLIIDEPEVHLHPKWEIEYAKIIVGLAAAGIPIVISSHSPYLLHAINVYIKEFKIEDKSKFYFGEKTDGGALTKFRDVTANLNPIFKLLSEPMRDLFIEG